MESIWGQKRGDAKLQESRMVLLQNVVRQSSFGNFATLFSRFRFDFLLYVRVLDDSSKQQTIRIRCHVHRQVLQNHR